MVNSSSKKLMPEIGAFCAQDLINKSGSGLYTLIRLAMVRSAQLAAGKPALIEHGPAEKIVTIVFKEIADGRIEAKNKKPSNEV